eukprot:scaffold26720_cov124-Isochrysis_galbana.AAC.4
MGMDRRLRAPPRRTPAQLSLPCRSRRNAPISAPSWPQPANKGARATPTKLRPVRRRRTLSCRRYARAMRRRGRSPGRDRCMYVSLNPPCPGSWLRPGRAGAGACSVRSGVVQEQQQCTQLKGRRHGAAGPGLGPPRFSQKRAPSAGKQLGARPQARNTCTHMYTLPLCPELNACFAYAVLIGL